MRHLFPMGVVLIITLLWRTASAQDDRYEFQIPLQAPPQEMLQRAAQVARTMGARLVAQGDTDAAMYRMFEVPHGQPPATLQRMTVTIPTGLARLEIACRTFGSGGSAKAFCQEFERRFIGH